MGTTVIRRKTALAALAGLALSAGPSAARAQRSRASVTLNFWLPLGDPIARSLIVPYFTKFEQSHPGITVNYVVVSHADNYVKYTTAMAAGRGPDVVMTTSFNAPVPEWAANGFIQPVDPWFKQLNIAADQWLPWVQNMQTFHGHTWGFIQQYDTFLLVWNKQLFKEAGLDPNKPPRTIAELDTYAKKLTKFDAKGNLLQAGFVPWVWTQGGYTPNLWTTLFGGHLYNPNSHTYTLNDPANVRSLAWMSTYAKLLGGPEKVNGLLGQFQGNNDPFYSGQVAMTIVGEWAPAFIPSFAPKFKYGSSYGAAAPPTAPGVPYGTNFASGGDTFVMPVGTKHPQEAAELMLYMMQPDPILAWCIGEANIPPTRSAIFDPRFLKGAPTDASAVSTARLGLANPKLLNRSSTSSVESYAITTYENAEQQVLYGRSSPQAALDAAQKLIVQQQKTFETSNPGWS